MSKSTSRFWGMSGTLLAGLLISHLAGAAHVRQFSPQGLVDQPVRATAVFDTDIVAFGRADAPAPFEVNCGEVNGQARWSNTKTWSYTLDRPLQTGERCDFRLKPGFKAANGAPVSGNFRYSFFAPGPWPSAMTPDNDSPIEEDQAFLIQASAVLKRESVERNVWCEADGVGNRIPVRFLPDATRDQILKSRGDSNPPAAKLLALTCSERLPSGAKVRLVWGKGVEAQNGAKSSHNLAYAYTVREPFRASFSCERERQDAPCSPLSPLRLEFSAPVDAKLVAAARIVLPDGKRAPQAAGENEGERETHLSQLSFKGPFPQNTELKIELPADLKDESGRALSNAASFPLTTKTGSLPPLAKFPGKFGILEHKEGGILPVTLRNVEANLPLSSLQMPSANAHRFAAKRLSDDAEVIAAMRTLEKFENQSKTYLIKDRDGEEQEYEDQHYARELPFLKGKSGVAARDLPKPGGSGEFEVVGIPLSKPGFHIVEIESRLLGGALLATPKPMYVRTTALVTNLAVHFKHGHENSLVWVTTLDSGKPVADAEVRVSSCDGKPLWQGRSDAQGRAVIDKALEATSCSGEDNDYSTPFLFISAHLGEDYSFARSDWTDGIESWRFGVETWGESGSRRVHTIFDRTLLRAGQTVSMKHVAREHQLQSFAFPDTKSLPAVMVITHDGSDDEFRQPLHWDQRGIATNQWKIPESAKRGSYSVTLRNSGKESSYHRIHVGSFQVSDFRLPVFAGSVQGVGGRLVAPKEVPLTLGLSFLNGGAAKGAKVEVSATLRPRWPEYKGYDDYSFNVGFSDEGRVAFAIDAGREQEQLIADKQALTLDNAGAGKLTIALPKKVKGPSELYAEMSFADPNGEIQTLHGAVELLPSGVVAGISVRDWTSVKQSGVVEVVVLDVQGKPVADAPVKLLAKRRIDYSHRKRIVGGFYTYEHSTEFKDLGEICKGKTDARGKISCSPRTDEPGSVYLLAETQDANGNLAYAGTSYWVVGQGDLWFTAGNQDRFDVIPEKRSYAPGETARLQVRTPFRDATALVSVEAGGIIETMVLPLSRFKPVIELPIKPNWGPNVFVSVLAVRGRVEPLKWYSFFTWGWREPAAWFKEWWNPTQPTAMVDLAKPAFKLGLAALDVGIEGFKLKVEVSPEKRDYQPRDAAQVKVKVTQPDGKPAPAGSEIAFAAVDQALLELKPNDSWNLLDKMLQRRAYEVQTATAQSQVIGKRHFGKKAVPPGGGGGRAPARELFDTLLLWNPRLALDAEGSATVNVPLNDSLTEFKLVAIADVGVGLFGHGSASLRTKQDLQLISGLPPLVREKDRYSALLTVRNGTAKPMTVSLAAKAGEKALEAKEVKLDAESAAEVMWSAEAPEDGKTLVWEFDASDKSSSAKDRLRITQQIAPAVPVTVLHSAFQQIGGKIEIPITPPAGAIAGKDGPRGGIEIGLSAKLSTPPPGLKRFFEEYPFSCLEQQISVAIGLQDKERWQKIVSNLPTYLDANGLARYFPGDTQGNRGSAVLTAYLLTTTRAAGFELPPELAQRMEQALAAYTEGRLKADEWSPQSDLVVRKLAAIEALTRRGQMPLSALSSLEIDPLRLPTSALIDWYLITKRVAKLPARQAKQVAAGQELRNRLSYQGGRLVFTNERADYWWWLMVSGDSNTFRLIEAVLDDPEWKEDLPMLVQGAMLRQQRGRWLTTTANTWATIALDRFGKTFEKGDVSGTTKAALGTATQSFAWPGKADESSKLMLPWPSASSSGNKLQLAHEGSGQPWASLQALAAIPVKEAKANGFRVKREVTPVQEKLTGKVSRGDVWRVRLTVEADQDMTWVVVNDPIPAGARILGEGDGRDSRIAQQGESGSHGSAWPAYVERTFSNYRAYYAYVPRGRFSIDYTVRLNNAGEFTLPATRVEAVYAPEIFGEAPNAKVIVE